MEVIIPQQGKTFCDDNQLTCVSLKEATFSQEKSTPVHCTMKERNLCDLNSV